ncbi:hypothetical protein ACRAWF_23440 [Streptomyces sp. L7]
MQRRIAAQGLRPGAMHEVGTGAEHVQLAWLVEEVGEERRERPRGALAGRAEQRAHQPGDGVVRERSAVAPRGAQHGQQVTARVGAPSEPPQRPQEGAQFGTAAPGGSESRTAPAVHPRGLLVRQPERGHGRGGGQPVAELGHQVGVLARGEAAGQDMGAALDGGGQGGQRGPAQGPVQEPAGLGCGRVPVTGHGDEPRVGEGRADVVVAAEEPGSEGLARTRAGSACGGCGRADTGPVRPSAGSVAPVAGPGRPRSGGRSRP